MSCSALSFHEAHHAANTRHWPAQLHASPRRIFTVLQTMWDAWREGLAAHERYEHLRSRGVPHDTAIRAALGIGVTPSRVMREAAKPLHLAGNA